MARIELEATLGITADSLWQSVGNFGGVSSLLDVIQESQLVDGTEDRRTCLLANGGTLAETLLSKDDGTRTLQYSITDGLPVADRSSSMQVLDAGDGRSTFRWITEYSPIDEAPEGFGEMFSGMLGGEVEKLQQRWPA